MGEETDQPLLARMVSINKPSFWVYFLACAIMFACSILISHTPMANWEVPSLIAFGIFIALLLELISQRLKNEKAARLMVNICYIFEALSVIAFLLILFSK